MPKMTHYFDPTHEVDVADEKVAVYEAQGWSVKSDDADASADEVTAVTRASVPTKRAASKRTAKKSS